MCIVYKYDEGFWVEPQIASLSHLSQHCDGSSCYADIMSGMSLKGSSHFTGLAFIPIHNNNHKKPHVFWSTTFSNRGLCTVNEKRFFTVNAIQSYPLTSPRYAQRIFPMDFLCKGYTFSVCFLFCVWMCVCVCVCVCVFVWFWIEFLVYPCKEYLSLDSAFLHLCLVYSSCLEGAESYLFVKCERKL